MGKFPEPISPQAITIESPTRSPRRRRLRARGNNNNNHSTVPHALSSSMPRLFAPSSPMKGVNRKDSVICGNESFSQIRMSFSLVLSMDDNEESPSTAMIGLLNEIKEAIDEQTNRKVFMEHQLYANLKLAKARYSGGSQIGAVLSMRKAHKNKSMKAYIAAARFQLIALRNQVQAALDVNQLDFNVAEKRSILHRILADLTVASCPMPDNRELLKQLQSLMMDVEV